MRPVSPAMACALLVFAGCARSEPPRLVLGEPSVARESDAVVVRAEIANAGGSPLLVDRVTPGCGCRLAGAPPETLAAGARATLVLACRPAGTPNDAVHVVRVTASDPAEPEQAFVVTLPVLPAVTTPRALYFGHVRVGAAVTRDLVVTGGAKPASASSVVTIEPGPAPGTYRVRFAPDAVGPWSGAIALGDGVAPVPVVGVGVENLLAFPAEVAVGAPGVRPPVVTLMNVGEVPLTITGVDYPPGLQGELKQVEPGREYRLTLRAAGAPLLTATVPSIRIRTDDAGSLTIPVRRLDG